MSPENNLHEKGRDGNGTDPELEEVQLYFSDDNGDDFDMSSGEERREEVDVSSS